MNAVSATEASLLQQSRIVWPAELWQRYQLLAMKLEDETLLPDEQQELMYLIEQCEEANVHRIAALIEIAKIRGTTLDALIKELGVKPPLWQ